MTPEQWEQIKEVFEGALERSPTEREVFLTEACKNDIALLNEIHRLLAEHHNAGNFLQNPVGADAFHLFIATLHTFRNNQIVSGRFRILNFIAQGGMGEVYEAEDLEGGDHVALKAIHRKFVQDQDTIARFKREVQLAKKVTHPNVCRIYELHIHTTADADGSPEHIFFLTMQLLPGSTLASYLRRHGRMTAGDALPIVKQIVAGLGAAHEKGIVHRDLKSANIILIQQKTDAQAAVAYQAQDGVHAVITDFGLARHFVAGETLSSVSNSKDLLGTPAYMAPEQIRGGEITKATDVYALGVVLFEMVTGQRPFSGDTPMAIAIQRLERNPPRPRSLVPELDPKWELAILRCLKRDPAERFTNAADVVKAITGEKVIRSGRPRQRRRVIAIVTAIVVVLCSVLVYTVHLNNNRTPIRPVATSTASFKLRRSLAVFSFRNLSGSQVHAWLSTAISEWMTTELMAGEELRTVSGESVDQMKRDLSISDANRYTPHTLAQIRNTLHTDMVLLGSYAVIDPKGDRLRIDMQVQDTKTGDVIVTDSETGTRTDLLQLIARTGSRLREKLGLQTLTPIQAEERRAALPSNPRATRLYAEGLERLRAFDVLGARDLMQKAVAADPGYVFSHAALAEAWAALGYDEKSTTAAKTALDLSAHLSKEHKLSIEARYREMTKDWHKAADLYQILFRSFPDDLEYGLRLVRALVQGGKGIDALTIVAALRRLPSPMRDDPRIDLAEARAAKSFGNYGREQELAASAAAKAQAQGARLRFGEALLEEAGAFDDLGNSQSAARLNLNAKAIYAAAGYREGVAATMNDMGNIFLHRGDLAEAKNMYQESLAVRRETGNKRGTAAALSNIGIILYRQGDLSGATKVLRSALAMEREIGDRNSTATLLNNLGAVLVDSGDLAGGMKSWEESLQIARRIGDQTSVARTLYNLGDLIAREGRLAEARKTLEMSVEISRQINDKRECAYALHGVGEVLLSQGDLTNSRKNLDEALSLRTEMRDKGTAAETRLVRARVSLEEGKLAQGTEDASEAAKEFRAEDNGDEEAVAQSLLARCLFAQERLLEARNAMARAAELSIKSEDRVVRVLVALDVSRSHLGSGNYSEAEKGLAGVLADTRKYRYVGYELEARLLMAEVRTKSGNRAAGCARLAAVQRDAKAKGYILIMRRAGKARADWSCKLG